MFAELIIQINALDKRDSLILWSDQENIISNLRAIRIMISFIMHENIVFCTTVSSYLAPEASQAMGSETRRHSEGTGMSPIWKLYVLQKTFLYKHCAIEILVAKNKFYITSFSLLCEGLHCLSQIFNFLLLPRRFIAGTFWYFNT